MRLLNASVLLLSLVALSATSANVQGSILVAGVSATTQSTYSGNVLGNDLINQGQATFDSYLWDKTDFFNQPGGLNNGTVATSTSPYMPVTFGSGDKLPFTYTVTLKPTATLQGYDITEVASFAGYGSNGRTLANQKYELLMSQVGSSSFQSFGTFTYTPFASSDGFGESASMLVLTDSTGTIASHIDQIRFVFKDPGQAAPNEINGTVYNEIDVVGHDSVPEPSSLILSVIAGLSLLCYAWRKRA